MAILVFALYMNAAKPQWCESRGLQLNTASVSEDIALNCRAPYFAHVAACLMESAEHENPTFVVNNSVAVEWGPIWGRS